MKAWIAVMWGMAILALSLLLTGLSSCYSLRKPDAVCQTPNNLTRSSAEHVTSTWELDGLLPDEGTTLLRCRKTSISINMQAAGSGNYAIRLWVNNKRFRQYKVRIIQGNGDAYFSGNPTWFFRVKRKIENVTVGLYRIEETESGKTEVSTLLKEITRQYDAVCRVKNHTQ